MMDGNTSLPSQIDACVTFRLVQGRAVVLLPLLVCLGWLAKKKYQTGYLSRASHY
jgi:hypothetical protein